MNLRIENRTKSCPNGCPYAKIYADMNEFKNEVGGVMLVAVEIYCEYESVCRLREEGGAGNGEKHSV